MKKPHLVLLTLLPCWLGGVASAQRLTLDNAIRIAQENSYSAQVAQFSYMASYWNYRSFKAQLMPAVNLRGKVANFDHSLIETRNYEDGRLNDVNNNTMSNYLRGQISRISRMLSSFIRTVVLPMAIGMTSQW